jgi:CTP:molybdopterin cytidylyltransferase MocA
LREPGLAGLLLAAGASTRMGRSKAALPLDGVPLARRAVDALAAVCGGPLVVVTGADREPVELALRGTGVELVHNAQWREGIGRSLAAGLAALPPDATAVLVLPCDLPLVGASELLALAEAWRRRPEWPAAAAYAATLGVPAIIPAGLFAGLPTSGETGAGPWLRARAERVSRVPMPAASRDLDSPADLAALANATLSRDG